VTNINGKTYALAAIAPMRPWKARILQLLLGITQRSMALQKGLSDLSMVHFARFAVVSRSSLAFFGGNQPKENLHYHYLLFFSNFNGTWNQYIDSFSTAISGDLNGIAVWTEKFPGSVPVTPFKRWIAAAQFDTDYYYSAYPHATVNDVRAAHRVEAALNAFAANAAELTPEEFGRAYLKFLVRIQGDLGTTGPPPVGD
jgi:hypothetical protein